MTFGPTSWPTWPPTAPAVPSGAGRRGDAHPWRKAQELLKPVQPQQVGMGKYNVQIGEARGVVIGDQAQVEMTFREKPKKK